MEINNFWGDLPDISAEKLHWLAQFHLLGPRGVRTSFSAASLHLSSRRASHHFSDLLQVDATIEVHLAGVDLQDVVAGRVVGVWKLDLPVNPARPEQRRIEDIDSVRGHQHLQ